MKIKNYNGKTITAKCSRCGTDLRTGVKNSRPAGLCPACGWYMIPDQIVEEGA